MAQEESEPVTPAQVEQVGSDPQAMLESIEKARAEGQIVVFLGEAAADSITAGLQLAYESFPNSPRVEHWRKTSQALADLLTARRMERELAKGAAENQS